MAYQYNTGKRWDRALAWVLLCCLVSSPALAQDDQLHRLRAERREASRTQSLDRDKSGSPARFGLLVIPVDFSDARLAADWNPDQLSNRLVAESGESLHNYFKVASGGQLELTIITAPVIHLPETRRLYSDQDLNGFTRTRRLATESITAVRDLGLEFRRLDIDGPDGVAGSGDDDGQVDGVLILHAGVGNENDTEGGLIQALQFYLEEPVVSLGVGASFYAVASLQSGPGIWAHETAHLLGMEDRYDPILHPAGGSEVLSVGGLGRFSLMGSGAWGTGDGYGAAMPDAYSAVQMGWRQARELGATEQDMLMPGEAARIWTGGRVGDEFFLLETRDPVANAPFDADVPGGQLLIYHIDETVAEGNWHEDGPFQWHLRARLVEADGDRQLAEGIDLGRGEDLFPGPLAVPDFGPLTIPASNSYAGGPSGIALTEITALATGVQFGVSLDTEPTLSFAYTFLESAAGPHELELQAWETGQPLGNLRCEVRAISTPANGVFVADGGLRADFAMEMSPSGAWLPDAEISWLLDDDLTEDSQTSFHFVFYDENGVIFPETRTWAWTTTGAGLNFRQNWPEAWTIEHPTGNVETTWHLWDAAPWLTADLRPVLACTGASFAGANAWPQVHYENQAHTTLTSEPLGAEVSAVRLTHAIEVEMLTGTIAMDGGLVVWVGPDGEEVAATPLAGYDGSVAEKSFSLLHGRQAFVSPALILAGDVPQWRTDTFEIPAAGTGPWRLRFVFGANSLWRARGWFIADIEPVLAPANAVGFVPQWNGNLTFSWPWPTAGLQSFQAESRIDAEGVWRRVWEGQPVLIGNRQLSISGGPILAALSGTGRQRHQIRVLGQRPTGQVASRHIVVYPDGGSGGSAVLSQPWPNPATAEVRFLLDIPRGSQGLLRIYDLRGRLVFTHKYPAGQQLVVWDGRSDEGFRVASGTYYLRLEGSGPVLTRKVVLIH